MAGYCRFTLLLIFYVRSYNLSCLFSALIYCFNLKSLHIDCSDYCVLKGVSVHYVNTSDTDEEKILFTIT